MTVGLLVIATRKYRRYLLDFMASTMTCFLPGEKIEVHLFSEEPYPATIWHEATLGWPDATLYRYHLIDSIASELVHCDYLFYSDVDMRFEEPIHGHDIYGKLVAVQHPGFLPPDGSWETRTESTAFVPSAQRVLYYAGGFQGGKTLHYLRAAHSIAASIGEDADNGITAVWHDESHWNRYLIDHKPKVLDPLYCSPEEYRQPGRKITALLKDHKEVRA